MSRWIGWPIGTFNYFVNSYLEQEILLRERKSHTDRGVSSTSPEVGYPLAEVPPLARPEGGTQGGVPSGRGTPQPGLIGGT